MSVVGEILVLTGAIFSLFGALGILRMPDMYNRLQAGTKATTLGSMSLILGVGLMDTAFLGKSLLLILFIVLTNPISSSTMARMGRRAGVSLGEKPAADEYSALLEREEAAE